MSGVRIALYISLGIIVALGVAAAITVPITLKHSNDEEQRNNVDADPRKVFALLIAGSNGIENYRHQADVAHAYHMLIANGIPKQNIVTMLYDDIASNPKNPTPGQIRNSPNGPDYYKELKIDYRSTDVNVGVFNAVLTGNSAYVWTKGTGRVLDSTTEDNIFVYYSDHGGDGILGMPTGPYLSKSDLQKAIKSAKYHEMSVYIESCESGSMLKGMEHNDRVFGLTASTATQSSYAAQCWTGMCYADEFSMNWLVDSENYNLHKHNLQEQYSDVKAAVQGSTVMRFGANSMNPEPVARFQGNSIYNQIGRKLEQQTVQPAGSLVDARDVPLYYHRWIVTSSKNQTEVTEAETRIRDILENRKAADRLMDAVLNSTRSDNSKMGIFEVTSSEESEDCYMRMVQAFHNNCVQLGANPYMAKLMTRLRVLLDGHDSCDNLLSRLTTICSTENHPNRNLKVVI